MIVPIWLQFAKYYSAIVINGLPLRVRNMDIIIISLSLIHNLIDFQHLTKSFFARIKTCSRLLLVLC